MEDKEKPTPPISLREESSTDTVGKSASSADHDEEKAEAAKETNRAIHRPPPPLMDLDKGLVGWDSESDSSNPM